MKILHTSDWHLGQFFMGQSRQAEHQAFIKWFITQVEQHQIDAVIIAGDIFDTGAPPSYARELYNHFIVALKATNTQLIVLAGNHDSFSVLEESKSLLTHMNTHVIANLTDDIAQQVITLNNAQQAPGALVCAIPFLRAKDLVCSAQGQTAAQKQQALQHAIQTHYHTLFDIAKVQQAQYQQRHGKKLPIIATGHLTSVGASSSESVREIYIGNLEAFPTKAFPAADYIALGHIHKPQQVGGLEQIRYSGSPIALSFDELTHQKQILLVELNDEGLKQLTAIPVPVFQPMASLSGNLQQLTDAITEQCHALTTPQRIWLELCITEDDYLNDLQQRLDTICEPLPCDILRIKRQRNPSEQSLASVEKETLDELSTQEVFMRRLAEEELEPSNQQELEQLYKQVTSKLALEQ